MPEQILADREWTLRNMLVSITISLFLVSHEAGHVVMGHCDTANAADYYIGSSRVEVLRKSKNDEIAADQYAACVLASMASELPMDATSRKGVVTYLVLQLSKFLRFLDILGETASGPDTHPAGDARCAAVLDQFEKVTPELVDSSAVRMTMKFADGFFRSVRSRLEVE